MNNSAFEPVRIGVVGLGQFGRQHACTLAGIAEANLVALVARRETSLDAIRDQLPNVTGWPPQAIENHIGGVLQVTRGTEMC